MHVYPEEDRWKKKRERKRKSRMKENTIHCKFQWNPSTKRLWGGEGEKNEVPFIATKAGGTINGYKSDSIAF